MAGVRWFDAPDDQARLLEEVERRYTRFDAYKEQARANPQVADRLVGHVRNYGTYAKPGVLMGMAVAGVDPGSDSARRIAQLSGRLAARQDTTAGYGDTVNGGAWQRMLNAGKAALRGAFIGLAAPFEEASAAVTAAGTAAFDPELRFGEAYARAPKSQARYLLGETAENISEDGFELSDLYRDFDELTGQGILPAGEIRERREQEKQQLALDGVFMTPGRLVPTALNRIAGRTVIEPGTKPYQLMSGLVDFAANVAADPASWLLGGVGAAGKAARTFGVTLDELPRSARAAAAVSQFAGPRKGVIGETVTQFLQRPEGGLLVDALVTTTSPNRILKGFGYRVDPEVARRLAKARDGDEVRSVLGEVLGTAVATKPDAAQFTAGAAQRTYRTARLPGVRRNLHGLRFAQPAPGRRLDLNDRVGTMRDFDAYLRAAKLPDEQVNSFVDQLIATPQFDWETVNGLVDRANDRIVESMVARGRSAQQARDFVSRVGRGRARMEREVRQYAFDYYGRPLHRPGETGRRMLANGEEIDEAGSKAFLLSHARGDHVELPDLTELRRLTSWMSPLFDTPVLGAAASTTIDVLANVAMPAWKVLALLRPALLVRVGMEEQGRVAATGDAALWNHPFQALAWMLGKKGGTPDSLGAVGEYASSMSARPRPVAATGREIRGWRYSGDFVRGYKGDEGDVQWWAGQIGRLAVDDVARNVAKAMQSGPDGLARYADEFLDSQTRAELVRTLGWKEMTDDAVAREHIMEFMPRVLTDTTGGNWSAGVAGDADLIDGIANGRIGDVPVTFDAIGGVAGEPATFGAAEVLDALEDYRDAMPAVLAKPRLTRADNTLKQRMDTVTDTLFSVMLTGPGDFATRSPVFKQRLWAERERLLPWMTPDVQQQVLAEAREANLDLLAKGTIARMRQRASRGRSIAGEQAGAIDEYFKVEQLSAAYAAAETKKLLYDLSQRSQFSEVMRVAAPFAEPWRDAMSTWARLLREQPAVVRRIQQGVEGARGAGFFYTDPTSGEEMFTYPGGHLAAKLAGLPGSAGQVDLTGRVSGLNLVTSSFLPGFGPVVQIPAGWLIPDRPKWDGLRDLVIPFGVPENNDTPGGVLDSVLPAWMKRAVTAINADPESDRLFGNTVADVMKMLASTGEYDNDFAMIDGEDGVRLLDDGKRYAKRLYWVRALAQTTLPTGPQPLMSIDTPEGLVALQALSSEYRKMQQDTEAGGYDTALERFVERFGFDATLAVQPKSQQVRYRATSKIGADWERENRDLVERFPLTASYYAPDDPEGLFDYSAYRRALEVGDRQALRPDEVVMAHNNVLGRLAYAQARRQMQGLDTTADGRAALARIRADLKATYPGFQSLVGIPERADQEAMRAEFAQSASDPRLRDTPVAQATRAWLELREAGTAWAAQIDGRLRGFASSAKAAPVRAWLREEAAELIRQYPEWAPVYDRVFSRELGQDDEDTGGLVA